MPVNAYESLVSLQNVYQQLELFRKSFSVIRHKTVQLWSFWTTSGQSGLLAFALAKRVAQLVQFVCLDSYFLYLFRKLIAQLVQKFQVYSDLPRSFDTEFFLQPLLLF